MAIPVNLISAMHKPVRNQYSNERWHFFLAFIGSLTDEMPLLKFAGLLRFKSQDRIGCCNAFPADMITTLTDQSA